MQPAMACLRHAAMPSEALVARDADVVADVRAKPRRHLVRPVQQSLGRDEVLKPTRFLRSLF
jgi:hypothetical protein